MSSYVISEWCRLSITIHNAHTTTHSGDFNWREMYYKQHFNRALTEQEIRDLAVSYMHGILWVLNYYHFGVCSWSWFFPYYFTPLLCGTEPVPSLSLSLCMDFVLIMT